MQKMLITNKPLQNCSSFASARDLVRIFFIHPAGDSRQARTVITEKRLMVFYFYAYIAL